MADGGARIVDPRLGFFDWDMHIGAATDPTSPLGTRLQELKRLWDEARRKSQPIIDAAAERREIYEEYINRANTYREARLARASNFANERGQLKSLIKNARQEVLSEIRTERELIRTKFHSATAGLKFYKPTDWFRWVGAGIANMGRRIAHRTHLVLHPVYAQTHQRKAHYRTILRQKGQDHASTDGILRKVQKAHIREAWRAAFMGRRLDPAAVAPAAPGGPAAGPAGPAPI